MQDRTTGDKSSEFLFEKLFVSSSLLKGNFPGYKIPCWWVFFSEHFVSLHSLLVCVVSEESDVTITCASIGKVFFPPQASFSIFRIFDFLKFQFDKQKYSVFGIYPTWCSLSFLGLWLGV